MGVRGWVSATQVTQYPIQYSQCFSKFCAWLRWLRSCAGAGRNRPRKNPPCWPPRRRATSPSPTLAYRDGKLSDSLKAEAQKAAALGRKPFVEFGESWCPPCIAIEQSLDDPRMAEAFKNTYIIQLDFDEWKPHLAGTDFRVVAMPIYYEIDKNGRSTGRTVSGGSWGADTPENMAPVLKSYFQK